MDTKGLQKEFISWCKSKNKSPKTKEETQQLFVSFMKEKHPEEYKAAVESQLKLQAQQAQKALHGAKLQYFKKLKNQCAEDEEVVYYKKGGSVNCGCKKKEDGGEVRKAGLGCSAVDKFKAIKRAGFGDTLIRMADSISGGGFRRAAEEKKKKLISSTKGPGTTKQPMEEAQRKNAKKPFKNDYSSKRVKDSEKDYLEGTSDHKVKEKCGGKVKKHQDGSVISQFKMHRLGGSLNGIPFYLEGTPKGGIEKSDNTRVLRAPNNGEGVYERTPIGYGDFLPLVGTWRAAQRIDRGEPNASYGDLIMNGAMDLLGAGMVGPVIKAAGKANRIHKALKSRGFTQITKEPTHWVRTPKYVTTGLGNKLYSWQVPFTEAAGKVIPNVDYTNVALLPLIQTLRVPATAPFK